MDLEQLFKAITQIGQSTNGGFTVIALIASISCWLLYRGTRAQFISMQSDLKDCNDKHKANDSELSALRKQHDADMDALYRRLNNVCISAASLWTIINMSGDRRGYKLPDLNEVLEGRMVIQIRSGNSEPGDKRSLNTPLVYSEDASASG